MISVYLSEETKEELEQRADDADKTVSLYVNDLIHRQFQQDAEDAIASEARAVERIREVTNIAVDEIQQTAAEIRDLQAKSGAYSAANFELLKEDRHDRTRRDALSTGAGRMTDSLDDALADLGGDDQRAAERPDSGDDDDTDPGDPFG